MEENVKKPNTLMIVLGVLTGFILFIIVPLRSGDYTLMLKTLRESDFAKNYYDSNTLQIIYDVMVKKPGEDYFETIAVYDEIIIPVGYSYESS